MQIIKATGERELFSKAKLCDSIKKAGAHHSLANDICGLVKRKITPGMSTTKIFRSALRYLVKENLETAARYSLRRGVAELGPAGFIFEQYIEAMLQAYDYKTERNLIMRGKCVSHEIDILAKTETDHNLVEVKYHNQPGVKTHVDVVMYSYARLMDITSRHEEREKGIKHFVWVITNTKFTSSAIHYAKCQGVKLTGWSYPPAGSLEKLLFDKKLFPVTVLPSVNRFARERFAEKKMVLAQDLIPYSAEELVEDCGLPLKIAERIIKEAQSLIK